MQTAQEAEEAADVTGGQADTLADALAPILGFERNSAEFWVQVAQLVVLILILRGVSQ